VKGITPAFGGGNVMRFTCIDFETANSNYESVCAVGIATFEKGDLIEAKSWLVRPHKDYFYFESINVMIHGITERDVRKSLEFSEIYKRILPFFGDSIVVAHNASFDMSVLRHVLTLYDIPFPKIDYLCTYKVAQKTWNGLENYKLDTICNNFNYDFHHHDAKEDAIACGSILNRAMREQGANNPLELAEKIGMKIGCLFEGGYKPCSIAINAKRKTTSLSSIAPQVGEFNDENELYQKKIVFTGTLESMLRREAAQKVVNIGGEVGDTISSDTDFLVMGIQDYSKFVDGKESNKIKKAKELIKKGKPIRIIDESTFLEFLKVGG
jgi:DNA polymerase-3 subunit epsilon